MPSWDEIINQVESAPNGVIDITRKEYISKLAEIRGRNVISQPKTQKRTA